MVTQFLELDSDRIAIIIQCIQLISNQMFLIIASLTNGFTRNVTTHIKVSLIRGSSEELILFQERNSILKLIDPLLSSKICEIVLCFKSFEV